MEKESEDIFLNTVVYKLAVIEQLYSGVKNIKREKNQKNEVILWRYHLHYLHFAFGN